MINVGDTVKVWYPCAFRSHEGKVVAIDKDKIEVWFHPQFVSAKVYRLMQLVNSCKWKFPLDRLLVQVKDSNGIPRWMDAEESHTQRRGKGSTQGFGAGQHERVRAGSC